jgi:hypothetical protein
MQRHNPPQPDFNKQPSLLRNLWSLLMVVALVALVVNQADLMAYQMLYSIWRDFMQQFPKR